MKPLFLLLVMVVACGKNDTGKPAERVVREEYAVIPSAQAQTTMEVEAILRQEVQRGALVQYHNTKWYNYRGQFLCRSVVIDAQTFKLVMQ
jgi:hypothetical protein